MTGSEDLSPAASWVATHALTERDGEQQNQDFYDMHLFYGLDWTVDLERYNVSCAASGGPLAVYANRQGFMEIRAGDKQDAVRVYSGAGTLLTEVGLKDEYGSSGLPVFVGFNRDEELVVFFDGGAYALYHAVSGEQLKYHRLDVGRVTDCMLLQQGAVVLTDAREFWHITDLHEPRTDKLRSPNLAKPPRCWTCIASDYTRAGFVEVLVAAADGGVLRLDGANMWPEAFIEGAVDVMRTSPHASHIALFEHGGQLVVVPADFAAVHATYATKAGKPAAMEWCGDDAIALYWYGEIRLFTMNHQVAEIEPPDDPVVLCGECDGVRVISTDAHHFIRRVPDPLREVFEIGSTTPGAMLFDIRKAFDSHRIGADKLLRQLKGNSATPARTGPNSSMRRGATNSATNRLPLAVQTCIDAAGHALDADRQRALLKAAVYGRIWLTDFPTTMVWDTCQQLRVLNAVRKSAIGRAITLEQLDELTVRKLVKLLSASREFLLALRIAEAQGLTDSKRDVLMEWATVKIATSTATPSPALLQQLLDQLQSCRGVPYAKIAEWARQKGRRDLAIDLCDRECAADEQVPLLMKLTDWNGALEKALQSCNEDLVYQVLIAMQDRLSSTDFSAMLQKHSAALYYWMQYCLAASNASTDLGMHKYLQTQLDKLGLHREVGDLKLLAVLRQGFPDHAVRMEPVATSHVSRSLPDVLSDIRSAKASYQQSSSGSRTAALADLPAAAEADEYQTLLAQQQKLEQETKRAVFVGLSLMETLKQMLRLDVAAKLQTSFKRALNVSEKESAWARFTQLLEDRQWEALHAWVNEKPKLPLQADSMALAMLDAIAQHASNEVTAAQETCLVAVISRVADTDARAQLFARAKLSQDGGTAGGDGTDGSGRTAASQLLTAAINPQTIASSANRYVAAATSQFSVLRESAATGLSQVSQDVIGRFQRTRATRGRSRSTNQDV